MDIYSLISVFSIYAFIECFLLNGCYSDTIHYKSCTYIIDLFN